MQDLKSAVIPLAAFLAAFSLLAVALFLSRKISGWLERKGLGRKEKTGDSDESYSMFKSIEPSENNHENKENSEAKKPD